MKSKGQKESGARGQNKNTLQTHTKNIFLCKNRVSLLVGGAL